MVVAETRTLSPRAQRTRESLLKAAAVVFPRLGFLNTRIIDITTEAGTANGSFYNYFSSKEEIFRVIIEEQNTLMFGRASSGLGPDASPYERIRAATASYVAAYREEAPLIAILEQVATFSPEFTDMRRETRLLFRQRVERRIRLWQEEGIVEQNLSVKSLSGALTSMVSNFCYMWFVVGEEYEEDAAVDTLSRTWARALGLLID